MQLYGANFPDYPAWATAAQFTSHSENAAIFSSFHKLFQPLSSKYSSHFTAEAGRMFQKKTSKQSVVFKKILHECSNVNLFFLRKTN